MIYFYKISIFKNTCHRYDEAEESHLILTKDLEK